MHRPTTPMYTPSLHDALPISVAEAARKAKAKKAVPAPGKVFTEDDLSGMPKEGVSVVGNESKKSAPVAKKPAPDGEEDLRSEEHTSELQSLRHLVCRLLLEKK